MAKDSQPAPSPQWSGTEWCPFCQRSLANGGAAFMCYVETSAECRRGFERWRDTVSEDIHGEWSG
jgi:hypothetical protein